MKSFSERFLAPDEVAAMDSKYINAQEAHELLQQWERLSMRVCFAVCMGDIAWHAHWVGLIHSADHGRWVHKSGQAANMVSIDQYKEIILTEDEELIGLRFRQPGNVAGLEVNLFIDKNDGFDEDTLPLINKIIQ
jgi:hypothetical protein